MSKNHLTRLLCGAVALLFLPAFLVRCASVMRPTGGPKDTLPPVIVAMTPANFPTPMPDRSKIYIEFDEFVQLKDQQKEFFTSPAMRRKPQLTVRGRGVVVQLRDTLAPNTTYALDFGSAIRDNNEGNPLYSMRYVFSTGGEIDSMICSGYTADAYEADSVPRSFLWFFPADSTAVTPEYDSTLYLHRPSVIARAENNGIFIAQNLKPVPYRIYAFEDTNGNQLYDPSVDRVGFLDEARNPAELPDFAIWHDSVRGYATAEPQLYLRMFTDVAFRRQMLSQSERPSRHRAMLYFNAAHPRIEELRFDSIPAERVIVEPQTRGRDTLALWFDLPAEELPDTIRGTVTYLRHDSLNTLQPVTEPLKLAWREVETKEQAKEREKQERERRRAESAGEEYTPPAEPNPFGIKISPQSSVNPETHLTAEFDYPLRRLDSASVHLVRILDDGSEEPAAVRLRRDTSSLRLWRIESDWQPGAEYRLNIPAGAITDIAGFSNDSIANKYTVYDPEQFAVAKIEVLSRNDGTKYIIQLLDGNSKLQQERRDVTGGTVQFNYIPAGDMKFRVIEDLNGNGRWDTGNVVERRQPERAELYANADGQDTFVARTNWEFEITIDMNKLFAPVTMESLSRMLEDRELQRLRREEEKRRKEGPQQRSAADAGSGLGLGGGGTFNTNSFRQTTGL